MARTLLDTNRRGAKHALMPNTFLECWVLYNQGAFLEACTRPGPPRDATRRRSARIVLGSVAILRCSKLLRGLQSSITRQGLRARYTHSCSSSFFILRIWLLRLQQHGCSQGQCPHTRIPVLPNKHVECLLSRRLRLHWESSANDTQQAA